jgi:hypothetical protein
LRLALGLALGFATASGAAHAEPSPADKETARSLMAQGREQRDKGDLAGALRTFQAADAIMHVPTTSFEVARTQVAMGHLLEARETLLATLRIPASPSDPAPFAIARKNAEALDEELTHKIPSLVVVVTPPEPGAPVTTVIDDQPLAASLAGVARKLDPGHHVVVARSNGAQATAEIDLAPGDAKTIELRITRPKTVTVEPLAPAETSSRGLPALAYVGFGVGAVGLAVGGITGLLSISKKSDLEASCPGGACPRSVQSDLDGARTLATVSNIGFGVAALGTVIGVVAILTRRPEASSPPSTARSMPLVRPRLAPYATTTGAGLTGSC